MLTIFQNILKKIPFWQSFLRSLYIFSNFDIQGQFTNYNAKVNATRWNVAPELAPTLPQQPSVKTSLGTETNNDEPLKGWICSGRQKLSNNISMGNAYGNTMG